MILEKIAPRYQQLYLTVGEEMLEPYRDIVLRGKAAPDPVLKMFRGTDRDALWTEDTPAGPVEIVYLADREDFENFLRIMLYKCQPRAFPRTMGAMTLSGIINWEKIRRHEEAYRKTGKTDWEEEQKRFTSVPANYKDMLILLSDGPYSGIPAERAGFPAEQWRELSMKIRLYHECSHVICLRKFPEQKEPVWDEVVADAIGLIGALGRYDERLAEMFLGVSESGYRGGRLENYIPGEALEETNRRVHALVLEIGRVRDSLPALPPYDLLLRLEEQQKTLWGG